jgi:hypothetical protein
MWIPPFGRPLGTSHQGGCRSVPGDTVKEPEVTTNPMGQKALHYSPATRFETAGFGGLDEIV